MFNSRIYWRIWIIVGIAIFLAITLVKGFEINIALITTAVSAAGISLLIEALIFKKFIWRFFPNIFYPWLCSIPYIGGVWKGEIISEYVFPESGEKGPPIEAMIEIKHQFDKIEVIQRTQNSYSNSYICDIWIDHSSQKYLCYVYHNDADENRDSNPMHDGTAKLRIRKDRSNKLLLEGHYFTGRRTTGKMVFKRLNTKNTFI